MNQEVGLWIDHKKTVIVIGKGDEIVTLQANMKDADPHNPIGHGKTPSGAKVFLTEDHLDRHQIELLNKYYADVITHLKTAKSIIIMGPGEAKYELEKRLAHAGLKENVLAIETVDKLTERQIAARVKKFFASQKLPIQ